MSEYLNRDDVLACFHSWIDKHGDAHEPDEMEEYRDIEALPSIEVVRCKDCKHRKKYNGEYHRCSVFERTIKNDDYCSFGERGDSE